MQRTALIGGRTVPALPTHILRDLAYAYVLIGQEDMDREAPQGFRATWGMIVLFCCLVWGKAAWSTELAAAEKRGLPNIQVDRKTAYMDLLNASGDGTKSWGDYQFNKSDTDEDETANEEQGERIANDDNGEQTTAEKTGDSVEAEASPLTGANVNNRDARRKRRRRVIDEDQSFLGAGDESLERRLKRKRK